MTTICIYDIDSKKIYQRLGYFLGLVYDLSWSSDSSLIAGASQDNTVKIFNINKKD